MAEVEAPKNASRKPSALLYVAIGSALLGAVAMGTVFGWSSIGILNVLRYPIDLKLNIQILTWINAFTTLCALAGVLTSGLIDQILGRKIALIIYGVPMIFGFICLWVAPNMPVVFIGSVLAGFYLGLISRTAPSYVSEISTENLRGMFCTAYQLWVTIGILLNKNELTLLLVSIFIISFSLGWGPIRWLMITEITPMKFQAIVNTVATCAYWGYAFLITFIIMNETMSEIHLFLLLTLYSLVSIVFVILFLPETKPNRSLKTMCAQVHPDRDRLSDKI